MRYSLSRSWVYEMLARMLRCNNKQTKRCPFMVVVVDGSLAAHVCGVAMVEWQVVLKSVSSWERCRQRERDFTILHIRSVFFVRLARNSFCVNKNRNARAYINHYPRTTSVCSVDAILLLLLLSSYVLFHLVAVFRLFNEEHQCLHNPHH